MKHTTLLIAACCLLPSLGFAQEEEKEFAVSVQLRPRAEYRNGALNPRSEGVEAASFINNRARLSIEYKNNQGLSMKLSSQHVGVWGQDAQIDKTGRYILNEAWAKMESKKGFFAQIGRQQLAYDDDRILGTLDWNVAGRYHDAAKLGYQSKEDQLHLILAFNQNDEKVNGGTYYDASSAQPYKTMQTLWYHHQTASSPYAISLMLMNLGWEAGESANPKTTYMQTMGTYMTYAANGWNLNGTFYYQTGKTKPSSGSYQSTSAYMWSLAGSYALDRQWSISLGSDYLSGNSGSGDKNKAFNPLYGTHHKFYGAMDYFYASSWASGISDPGLWDNRIGIAYKASSAVNWQLNYHHFSTAGKISDGLSKSLGSECDIQVDWSVMKDVKLTAGYSFMRGTETMDIAKGGSHSSWQDWGWLSLNINPKIFFSKW